MYGAVPITRFSVVSAVAMSAVEAPGGPQMRARPKSRIFTSPEGVTRTLLGFRSRCTMPAAWAASRPEAIWTAKSSTCGTARGLRSIRVIRSSPGTNSMARKGTVAGCGPVAPGSSRSAGTGAASLTSKQTAMCGSLRQASARASRIRRARDSGSRASASERAFTATTRSSRVSRALKTTPMPPWPIRSRISYSPSRPRAMGAPRGKVAPEGSRAS